MLRSIVALLSIALSVGCAGTRVSCPPFPVPSEHVADIMDVVAEEDREVWEWGNKLLDLCQKLGQCEEE